MKTGFKVFCIIAILGFALGFFTAKDVNAATLCVNTTGDGGCFTSIQAAITAAADGDTITIANGTYTESLNIYKNLTLTGESESGVVIDTSSFNDYGIDANGDYTTSFSNFTLVGPTPTTYGYGIKVSGENAQTTIQYVTVRNSGRSGIDLNGLIGGTIDHVTLTNNGGVGLAITDSSNIAVSNITTSGNAWAGMAVFAAGRSWTGGSSNITLSGTNSFGELTPLYFQEELGQTVTNVTHGFGFMVENGTDRPGFYLFYADQATASAVALGLPTPSASSITNLSDGSIIVVPGMSIQAAINAAAPGDIIKIYGTNNVSSVVNVNRAVTLSCDPAALITVSGTGDRFDVSAAATIEGCSIQKTDKTGEQNIIRIRASGVTIQDNTISGQFVIGDPEVSRAIVINAGSFTGLLIDNNVFSDLRQPAYISGTHTGVISNNQTSRTKGWVLEGGNLTFTGNTWGTGANANVYDIAILGTMPASYYQDVPAMSAANNNAFIEDQRTTPATLSIVYVDGSVTTSGDGTERSPKKTIAEGITRVATGGTVYVAAGTYNALNIQINKSLTLLGDPGDAAAGPGINAPVVTGGGAYGDAFKLVNGVTNVTISGFEVTNYTTSSFNGVGNAVSAWVGSTSNITIRDNYFHDLGYNAILVGNDYNSDPAKWGDHTNWLVTKNITDNCGYIGFELTNTSNSTISDNVIHLDTPYIGAIFSSARRSETGLTISNNLIDGTPSTAFPVIYVYAYDLDMASPNLNDVLIEGNTINTTGTPYQVYIRNIGTGTVTGVQIEDNSLYSVRNLTAVTLDASPNYWGSASGPTPSQMAGVVSFVPWCLTSECTTFGYPPVHNITQDTYFATIQAAITAAVTGDEIHVSPGTYVESLDIIGKDITLRAPTGATIESPVDIATDFTTSAANSAVVYVNTSTTTIDGFTIDGASHGNANYRFYGVAYYNAGGTIENLTVKNIQDTPFSGAQHGNAIYAYNADGVARTLNVSGNTVYDFQKNGITMNGNLLTANVDDNTVTCKGTIDITAQNGIQFGWGASGAITNNTVTGCSYNKDTDTTYNWGAAGVLIYGTGAVTVTGNNISGNSQNLYIQDPTAAITVGANTFGAVTGPVGLSYQVTNFSDFDLDLSLSTFEGLLLSGATPEQLLAFAARVFDGLDDPDYAGVAMLQDGYQFVDAEGSIQAAIDAADPGDIIMVAAGTYEENVIVNKTVEIFGAGQGNTIVIPAISGANPSGCGSLCPLASSVFLVQANDVTIHDLTVEGNNPDLTGVTSGGVDVDARNGIITNHSVGVFNNLEVYNTTVQNIFLRGIYPSSGGTFNVHHNTVTNVQGNASSIAIFGWGGPGTFANNTVSYANDGISANHSKGIQFLNNTVTHSGSGIHTDNSGDSAGSVSDVITGNTVSNCAASGYGIWTFVNYLPITVSENTVSGCEVAYSVWGGNFTDTAQLVTFTDNTATAPAPNTNSVGIYITTDTIGWGYTDVLVNFTDNTITGFENGLYMTVDEQDWNPEPYELKTITGTFLHNQITGSTTMAADLGTTPFLANMEANWWGSAVKADFQAKIDGSIDFNPWCGDAACSFLIYDVSSGYSIQAAIDAASPGDTVLVGPGTYNESLIINKALTLKSTDGAATTILDVPDGTLTTGIKVLGTNLGEVTIDGFTVKDFTEGGIIQGMASHEGTTVHVLNNIVIPAGNYLRNGIQVSGDYSTVIGNYVQGAHLTADWSGTGILVVNASHVLVEDNTVYGNGFGMDTGIGVANWNAGLTITDIIIRNNTIDIADYALSFTNWTATSVIDGVTFENNLITNFTTGIDAYNNGTISNVDASPNWWGTIAGLTSGQMLLPGAVTSPWCGETTCTRLYPIQTGIPENTLTTWDKSYNWTGIPGATFYILNVRNSSGVLIKNIWVSAADAQCSSDLSCSYIIPSLELANGLYSWRVEDYGAYGHGLWTEYKPFVLNILPTNTILSPINTMTSWDKTFQWTGNAGATYYILNVRNASDVLIKNIWVSAADAQCTSDTSCSFVIPNLNLVNGSYSWRVQNYGFYGYGQWTAYQPFVLSILPLNTLVSPITTMTSWDKTFQWTGNTGATYYILNVRNATGTLIKNIWVSAADAQCASDTSCTYIIPNFYLANGSYSWRVQNFGAYGYGQWTVYQPFVLNILPLNTLLTPLGTVTGWDKTFQWTGNTGATYYIINVKNASDVLIKNIWVSAADAQCASDTSCTYIIPSFYLANGSYSWRVQNYGLYGYGQWSTYQGFTLQ